MRAIDEELALLFFLTNLVHISKYYPPRGVEQEDEFNSIDSYYKNMKYAHCGHKAKLLEIFLDTLNRYKKYRVILYKDINNWAHSFVEVSCNGKQYLFCPTFNMFLNTDINNLIKNPWIPREVLYLYSQEYYKSNLNNTSYEEFYSLRVDSNLHTTLKYNREWFAFIGFYPWIPPIYSLTEINNDKERIIYDIQKDKRFKFIK